MKNKGVKNVWIHYNRVAIRKIGQGKAMDG